MPSADHDEGDAEEPQHIGGVGEIWLHRPSAVNGIIQRSLNRSSRDRASAYEVKLSDHAGDERLYVGKASDLRMRVRQGLVKGKVPHPGGARIRAEQDLARLMVRWSLTDPAAVEEELHRAYVLKLAPISTQDVRHNPVRWMAGSPGV